jgi:hypothetical protein
MPATLPTTFYAILFGDGGYEFFDTESEAFNAAMALNRELRESYGTGAEDPVRPIPIARVEIEPLDRRRLLRLLNDGAQTVVRSQFVVRVVEPDGTVTLATALREP